MFGLVISIAFLLLSTTLCREWALKSYLYPKYSLNYIDQVEFKNTVLSNDSMLEIGSIASIGKNTNCFKPHLGTEEISKEALQINIQAQQEFEKSVLIINEQLSGRRLDRRNSDFLYQFYFGQNVSQWLVPSEELYNAGMVASATTLHNDSLKLAQDTAGYYVKEIYGDGELCENTNMFRTTEVRYLCVPNVPEPRLLEASEFQLCRYGLVVAVPGLCRLQLFSHDFDQQQLHPILYSEADQDVATAKMGHSLLRSFVSHFLGHNFYHLQYHLPYHAASQSIAPSKLLFTGELVLSNENSELHPTETVFLEKAIKAFQNINAKDLFETPDGSHFTIGDYELKWESEVIDKKGRTLCVLEIDIDATSRANVSFYKPDSMSEPVLNNIIHYSKVIHDYPAPSENLSTTGELQIPDRAMSFDIGNNIKTDKKPVWKKKELRKKEAEDLNKAFLEIRDSLGLEVKLLYAMELEDDKPEDDSLVEDEKEIDKSIEPGREQIRPTIEEDEKQVDAVTVHDEL
ncbi:Yos9p LALA0_S09e03048g [Lachancea lanzarotensis]|uniref:Endoplasmic reticulum lectin n=1 Tax=Lachancea lanzarotensis TaxID=1245769 RepID=A0A0C7N0Z5_9SACH|nr:uncharacterized protein LALA0_S09e03048g [Lachancea lanzarotensis]CEP63812.1 LALA0S09e03048g1_1 [Lachancea lanzarotensis]